MTAYMLLTPLMDDNGKATTNGPVLIAPESEQHPAYNFAWNIRAFDLESPRLFQQYSTALCDIVREMGDKPIFCMRIIRNFQCGIGVPMSLWEVKHTFDAVKGWVIHDAQTDLTYAVQRADLPLITRSVAVLQRLGALEAELNRR